MNDQYLYEPGPDMIKASTAKANAQLRSKMLAKQGDITIEDQPIANIDLTKSQQTRGSRQCKQCGSKYNKMVTTCPNCGDVSLQKSVGIGNDLGYYEAPSLGLTPAPVQEDITIK